MKSQNNVTFETGQRVLTPDGEGEVVKVKGDGIIIVKLNSGEEKEYTAAKLSDDSDAG